MPTAHPDESPDGTPDGTPDEIMTSSELRARVAAGLLRQRESLAARIRRQLASTGAPPAAAEDVLSTTLRRTDVLAAAGRIADDVSDRQLLALATAISMRAAFETSRRNARDRRRVEAASEVLRARPAANEPRARPGDDDSWEASELEAILGTLSDVDLAILGLRIRGAGWPVVAEHLGTTPAGAHRRYYRAIQTLAEARPPQSEGDQPDSGMARPSPRFPAGKA